MGEEGKDYVFGEDAVEGELLAVAGGGFCSLGLGADG